MDGKNKQTNIKKKWSSEKLSDRQVRGQSQAAQSGSVASWPHANEHVAVAEDEQQYVVLGDVMEVGILLIGEEEVGLPETLEHVGVHRQRLALKVGGQAESWVVPPLAQEDVHPVVL